MFGAKRYYLFSKRAAGVFLLALSLFSVLILCSCSSLNSEKLDSGDFISGDSSETTSSDMNPIGLTFDDMRYSHFALLEGSAQELPIRNYYTEGTFDYFKTNVDGIAAVSSGKAAAMCLPRSIAYEFALSYDNICVIEETFVSLPTSFAFPKGSANNVLFTQLNTFLETCEEDGRFDLWKKKWLSDSAQIGLHTQYATTDLTGENGTIHVIARNDNFPYEYLENGRYDGYEMEILFSFCYEYGYAVEIDSAEFASIILSIATNKYDFAVANVSETEERKESMDFSHAVCYGEYCFAYNVELFGGTAVGSSSSSLKESFEKTFLRENRWQLVLGGLCVTIIVTIFAALLGTCLGFVLAFARRKDNRVVNKIIDIYVRIFQGTPVLVMLLIFYYVVFGSIDVSSIYVAILVFGLNSAAFIYETLHSSILSVHPGQLEAAIASGFTEKQAFKNFVLPTAIRRALPVYRGEIISLLKSTSIVGYIALVDLTKAGDIIRSRTYEALFPLLAIAILYLIMGWIISIILKYIEKRLTRKHYFIKLKDIGPR